MELLVIEGKEVPFNFCYRTMKRIEIEKGLSFFDESQNNELMKNLATSAVFAEDVFWMCIKDGYLAIEKENPHERQALEDWINNDFSVYTKMADIFSNQLIVVIKDVENANKGKSGNQKAPTRGAAKPKSKA